MAVNYHYVVEYRVCGHESLLSAGPYDHEWVAWEHRNDIAGFDGVHSARVVRKEVASEEATS